MENKGLYYGPITDESMEWLSKAGQRGRTSGGCEP